MKNKWLKIFLTSALLNSTGALATLFISSDLLNYSVISGAALTIEAGATVSGELAGEGAVGIGANATTGNVYSGAAAGTGAGSVVGNVYSSAATNIGANATAGDIYSGDATGTGDSSIIGQIYSGAAANVAANGITGDIYSVDATVTGAMSNVQNIYSGAAITLGGGSSAGDVSAVGAITNPGAARSTDTVYDAELHNPVPFIEEYGTTFDTETAMAQISSAQASYNGLTDESNPGINPGTSLAGDTTFTSGIYTGTSLTTAAGSTITLDGENKENPFWLFNLSSALSVGATNEFIIINADENASVVWNLGGALTLGASTSFIGTVLATGAISGGAGSYLSCGNLFSKAAVAIGSVTSSDCPGLASNMAQPSSAPDDEPEAAPAIYSPPGGATTSVPEPSTLAIFVLGLIVLVWRHRRLG